MNFRNATESDTQALLRLWEAVGLGGGDETDNAEITERLRNDDGFFVIGEDESGALIAAAMGCYDNHRGWVKRVAIDPAHQGAGLGHELMNDLEGRFVAAGITKLRLAVWEGNTRAGAFWEERDYVELPEIRYFTKDLDNGAEGI